MEASVTWDHGMTFTGTADSDFTIKLGASPAVGGDDDGFRPLELMLVGLVGCTAMDVIAILRKKRQAVTGLAVKAQAARASEHPKVFTGIQIQYIVRGHNIDPKAVTRAIELSEKRYCPAQAMMGQIVPIELAYEIVEE